MKKILAICSVFLTICAFTSCGSESGSSMNGDTRHESYASNYDSTGDRRDDNVGDYVSGAADEVGEAGKDIVTGAGEAGKDLIDGVESAADHVIDGVDGHDTERSRRD